MAPDAQNRLTYYLLLHNTRRSDLGAIRHWANLKVGLEADHLWLKGFTPAQLQSVAVQSIPFKTIYYENPDAGTRGKLCRLHSLLPDQPVPEVLWTSISRALPVELPAFNHNYFGISEKVTMRLVPVTAAREAVALLVSLQNLQPYLESAPAVRVQKLQWALLDGQEALLLGTPLLPVPGAVYWQQQDFLLPVGYDFEFPVLAEALQHLINPTGKELILFQPDAAYVKIPKTHVTPLALSAFRLTLQHLAHPEPDA